MQKKILITGGAGYIGSHTVHQMVEKCYEVIVLDNLVYGHKESIEGLKVEFIQGDLSDRKLVREIFQNNMIDAVIHFAAYSLVGESVTNPSKYFHNNTAVPLILLDTMKEFGSKKFIFSSTCATYGVPQYCPIDEKHPQNPINPYGISKLMLEKILDEYDRAYGIKNVKLRYFNACGAKMDGLIGEDHRPETHLIPLILMAAKGERDAITIFGTDYDTPDGTCIRDYIHVLDLADAHIKAYEYLNQGGESVACNLGTGNGNSVKEVIDAAKKVTGMDIPVVMGERREGDPPELVAHPGLAANILGWEAQWTDVEKIIESAWKWMNSSLNGRFD